MEKVSLLAPFKEYPDADNPYEAAEAAVKTIPMGGDAADGGADEESRPRQRRAFGWTSKDGVRGIMRYAANPTKRVETGIWPIDNLIGGGVGRGEVCVIIGKSGSGKSIVGQNILEHNLKVPAVFFSFEMPGTMAVTRSIAIYSGLSHDEVFNMVENNKLDQDLLKRWAAAHDKHYFVTRTGLDLNAMSQTLKEAEETLGERPAIVVIDYMELVAAVSGAESIEAVTSVAQLLKGWAKEEEVACVILHQTNKSLRHGDAPDEDSARYGGFTEADVVIGVWRPHKWEPRHKNETQLPQPTKDYLKKFYGINLIKNRPKIELHEQGYLVPILPSGKIDAPKGTPLQNCIPGGGPF